MARYGEAAWEKQPQQHKIKADGAAIAVRITNRLAFDVEFYARQLLALAEAEVGHLYPADAAGRKPIAYYWARVATCSNPSCRAEVPLLRSFYLVKMPKKRIYLRPLVTGNQIDFTLAHGECTSAPFVQERKSLKCPCCGNATPSAELKVQFRAGQTKERLLAVIYDSPQGKEYRLPTARELAVVTELPADTLHIHEKLPAGNTRQFDVCPWGFLEYGQLFSARQRLFMQALVQAAKQVAQTLDASVGTYGKAVVTNLAIFVDRIALANTAFGIWHTGRETLERPMGRQAFAMVLDYPESHPFSDRTASALNQLDWITRYLESESETSFTVQLQNASSGDVEQFPARYLTAVVTDPPYYDAYAYADLADFFYIWQKRILGDVYQLNFTMPQTPKEEECTALPYQRGGRANADKHFELKLREIFSAIEHQTSDVVSIMFAHQDTKAWSTLINSVLSARLNVTGSWAIDSEMTTGLKSDKAVLESSVTVACRPVQRQGYGDFRTVKREIEATVKREVNQLYRLGFRGADLLTACFGQAVSVFGQYEHVEKADGTAVTVAELLEMARESAFNALVQGFDGDDFTRFYIAWLQLYGFTEAAFDDVAKFTRVGLAVNVAELVQHHLFRVRGNKLTLATYAERLTADRNLGQREQLIDQVHAALSLYKQADRRALLRHLARVAPTPDFPFWRVLTALVEVLPNAHDDHNQALGLLDNQESLLREARAVAPAEPVLATGDLFAQLAD